MAVDIISHVDQRSVPRFVCITPIPNDSGENASYAISRDTDGNVDQIDKTIEGDTFRRTLTWTAGVLTAVSTWAKQ